MTTVTTWSGWEASALRKALRMSGADFAEHLGVARRTVAKWSSRGRDIHLRTEMQAALDTALARASPEARERFERLRSVGGDGAAAAPPDALVAPDTTSAADTPERGHGELDQDGEMQRRRFLADTAAGGVAAVPAVARLLEAMLSTRGPTTEHDVPPSLQQFTARIAAVKSDYQACRYDSARDRLVGLLPAVTAARSQMSGAQRTRLDVLAADMYHVVASVLLKCGDQAMALVAAERSTRCGQDSADPVAVGTGARIMTHALMSNGHCRQAVALAQTAAADLERATRLGTIDSAAVFGALLLRGAIAAAQAEDRDAAGTMLGEAERAAVQVGHDGNDRWTGFGPNNVRQHRVTVALALGDAGTAIAFARRVQLDKITLAERKASLFVDVAQAYIQWGRHDDGLSALRAAHRIAPQEIRSRPAVHRIVADLAALTRGHTRGQVLDFAIGAGIRR